MTEEKSNVVAFPKDRRDSPPQSEGEMFEQIINYRMDMAEELSETLSLMVVGELSRFMGAMGQEDEAIIVFLAETIKAIYLKSAGISHPIDEIATVYYEKMSGLKEEVE